MTTWYIAPTGNDTTGNGTAGNPYLTINKCHTVGADGDTIICADGIYRPAATTISKNNFTIQPANGASPTFYGSTQYTSWALTSGQTVTYETACTSKPWGGCYNGTTLLTSVASIALVEAGENTWYWNANVLYVHIAGGGQPTSIEAINTLWNSYFLTISGTGNTISGLRYKLGEKCISLTGNSNTVQNCAASLWGVWAPIVFNVTAASCVLSANTATLVFVNGTSRNCLVVTNTASALTVNSCTFSGGGINVLVQGGAGHVFANCTMRDPGQPCMLWSGDAAGTISDCTFINGAYGTVRGDVAHLGTVTVKNCTFTHGPDRLPETSHPLSGLHLHGALSTWNFYHNTFYNLSTGTQGWAIYCNPDAASSMTLTIKNNIIDTCDIAISVDGTITKDFDYNCYNNNGANFSGVAAGDQGTHNVTSDPLFTDSTTHDLTLQVTSPCLDAGVVITNINDGGGGSTKYRGAAPDIGYYEYPTPARRTSMLRIGGRVLPL